MSKVIINRIVNLMKNGSKHRNCYDYWVQVVHPKSVIKLNIRQVFHDLHPNLAKNMANVIIVIELNI